MQPKPRLGNNKELAQAAADHTMPHTLILVTVKSCDRGNMGKLKDTKPNQKTKSEKQIRKANQLKAGPKDLAPLPSLETSLFNRVARL